MVMQQLAKLWPVTARRFKSFILRFYPYVVHLDYWQCPECTR